MILAELAPIMRVTWQRLENVTAQQLKIDGTACMHMSLSSCASSMQLLWLDFSGGHNCCGLCYTKSSFIKKDR